MALELTFGRTTFSVRRRPVRQVGKANLSAQGKSSFLSAYVKIFNGTWEAKAGAFFPKQLSAKREKTELDKKDV